MDINISIYIISIVLLNMAYLRINLIPIAIQPLSSHHTGWILAYFACPPRNWWPTPADLRNKSGPATSKNCSIWSQNDDETWTTKDYVYCIIYTYIHIYKYTYIHIQPDVVELFHGPWPVHCLACWGWALVVRYLPLASLDGWEILHQLVGNYWQQSW